MKTWIDFKALRAKLDFEQVLRHYGVEVKRKGNQHQGFCPLPLSLIHISLKQQRRCERRKNCHK